MSETPDQAATRRRWITLAELVAVAGVVIAALTLWSNWADRRADDAGRAAEARSDAAREARVRLTATPAENGQALVLADAQHELGEVTLTFPRALGVAPQRPADARIDAAAIAPPLLALTDGGADDRSGRLPVLIAARYWDGDRARRVTGLYDIVWRTEGRMLRGRRLRLEALRLRQPQADAAALEAAWTREAPAKS